MKTTRYSLIMLLVFVLTGCTVVEVPEFDDTPPTYSFTIEGDDFQHVFTDKDDRSTYQLNVKPNVTYDFMYVSHDDGGVWRDEITVLTEPYMNLTIVEQGNYTEWDVKDVSFLSRIVSWQHREGSPVKDGNFLRGSFTFKPSDSDSVGSSFHFVVSDFGGENGNINQTTNSIPFHIAADNKLTEIVEH